MFIMTVLLFCYKCNIRMLFDEIHLKECASGMRIAILEKASGSGVRFF